MTITSDDMNIVDARYSIFAIHWSIFLVQHIISVLSVSFCDFKISNETQVGKKYE